jgi:undecaprenyl diphosphate synthase
VHTDPIVARALALGLDLQRLPKHVAFIMDGNGRWASRLGHQRTFGHRAGVKVVRELVETCRAIGVQVMTVYAFSTENWRRPGEEVNFLMRLFQEVIRNELRELASNGVRMRFIGETDGLAPKLIEIMREAEADTAGNGDLILNVAINYGGRSEILRAVNRIAEGVQAGTIVPGSVDDSLFASYLDTAGQPDPDLIVRTGGDSRLSNYLLWQMAYAEIYVTETMWPDFGEAGLFQALADYQGRDRRFGAV